MAAGVALLALGGTGSVAHADTARTVLSRNEVPGIEAAPPTGAVAPTTVMHLNVVLRRPDAAGEAAFQRAVNDPSSPQYRDFLSPAAFDARFGVSPSDYQRALDWLHAGGLQVTTVPGSREDLLVTGPASAVENLLQVHIRTHQAADLVQQCDL